MKASAKMDEISNFSSIFSDISITIAILRHIIKNSSTMVFENSGANGLSNFENSANSTMIAVKLEHVIVRIFFIILPPIVGIYLEMQLYSAWI
jgi:hypothetical protein